MKNPFPGLNPYLQGRWQAAHARLIVYLCDALLPSLPSGLVATIEEGISIDLDNPTPAFRPDLHIHDSGGGPGAGGWQPSAEGVAAPPQPLIVTHRSPLKQRDIEIIDTHSGDRVVTVIEVLSPANKQGGEGMLAYREKQRTVIAGGASFVEIDLVRGFRWTPLYGAEDLAAPARAQGLVAVTRAARANQTEFYPCPLRLPLPTIPIPLRTTDKDALVAMQEIMNRTVENSGLSPRHYHAEPEPPLAPEDAAWAATLLKAAGLRE